MNCECEQLSDLREKSDDLRDLGEKVREYAEIDPTEPFLRNALAQRVQVYIDGAEDYTSSFIKACSDGRIYSRIKGLRLNSDMTHLAAVSQNMFQKELYPITYHCAQCDEELLGELDEVQNPE